MQPPRRVLEGVPGRLPGARACSPWPRCWWRATTSAPSTWCALAVAVTKATLVVLYFMHARYSERLTHVVIASSVVFLAILVFLLLTDYVSRPWSLVAGG